MTAVAPAPYRSFRTLTPEPGDVLDRLGRDGIYDHGRMMAPGGLLLLDRMVRMCGLQPHSLVLDVGCGRAQSSRYLASELQCQVSALDLWVPPNERVACDAGAAGSTTLHLTGDFGRGLPEGSGPFDALIALQSFHAFGTSRAAIRYAASLLRRGGKLVLGQTCFSTEPDFDSGPFSDCGGLHSNYGTYRTLGWWTSHLESEHRFRVDRAEECSDGPILWEDHFLYMGDQAGWSTEFQSTFSWLGKQIHAGQNGGAQLTHLIISAERQ